MRWTLAAFAAAIVALVPMSCESTSGIGMDLIENEVTIKVDSSFTLTGHSVRTESVLSRTVVQLLGIIDAPEYGYIHSDFVTQFMPANSIDTVGITAPDIDSIKLVMLVNTNSFVGDSMALMGLEVYPLTKQLEIPIYSDFNPEGYYNPSDKLGSLVYNLTKSSEPESMQKNTYYTLEVPLPIEMGRNFFNEFVKNPATYASPTSFAKFFPGLYIKNSYGSGRITRIGSTTIDMYYHQDTVNDKGNDTTYYKTGTYFAVTPEIITNNDITLDISSSIEQKVAAGQSILLAPTGLEVEIGFPGREIIDTFKKGTAGALGVVNRLTMSIPVEEISNKYDIGIPNDILMVLKKDRDKFFIENKLPDDITSFRSTLTTLADGSQAYVFSDMRDYLLDLMKKDTVTDDDVTFMIVPVTVNEETNSDYYGNVTVTLTAIVPYVVEPKMGHILLEKAKINFVYSKQTTNY